MWVSLVAVAASLFPPPDESATGFARFAGNSRIQIGKSANMLDLRKDFTIEIWTRFQKTVKDQYFAGNEAWPEMSPRVKVAYNCGWVLRKRRERDSRGRPRKRGADRLEFTFGTLQKSWNTLSYKFQPSGAALHLAVCRKDDRLTMYVNGKSVARTSLRGLTVVMSPTPIYVGGRRHAPADRRFRGDVQAFRISTRSLYGIARFKPPTSLKADKTCLVLYDFAQQSEKTKAIDLSSHKRNGALQNVVLFTTKSAATAKTANKKPSDRLPPNGKLKRGESLVSKNGKFQLTMENNGHLTLRRTADKKVLWSTPTKGRGVLLHHQADGNIIVRNAKGRPVWTTRTNTHKGTLLIVQDDGNIVLTKGRRALWASGTSRRAKKRK